MEENYYGKKSYSESNNDFILRRLRNFGLAAYNFLHECDGHQGVLLYGDVEAHIKEMWHLWHLLDGTWNESRRFSEDYLTKMCEDMRNKPIRTKGPPLLYERIGLAPRADSAVRYELVETYGFLIHDV